MHLLPAVCRDNEMIRSWCCCYILMWVGYEDGEQNERKCKTMSMGIRDKIKFDPLLPLDILPMLPLPLLALIISQSKFVNTQQHPTLLLQHNRCFSPSSHERIHYRISFHCYCQWYSSLSTTMVLLCSLRFWPGYWRESVLINQKIRRKLSRRHERNTANRSVWDMIQINSI